MTAVKRKLTKNQDTVLTALREDGRPLSAYQLLDVPSVRDNGLKAPLTIYRALDKLIAYGMVHRIESLNAFVVCEHEPHHDPAAFMICRECRRTIEVGTDAIKRTVLKQAEANGFEIDRLNVEVTGRCENCTD